MGGVGPSLQTITLLDKKQAGALCMHHATVQKSQRKEMCGPATD